MTYVELRNAARRLPFTPFRLVLDTGEGHDIRHPNLILVGRRAVVIGLVDDPMSDVFERTVQVGLFQIAAIDELSGEPFNN